MGMGFPEFPKVFKIEGLAIIVNYCSKSSTIFVKLFILDVCENCGYVSVLHSREGYFRETQKVIYSLYFSQMFKVKRNNALKYFSVANSFHPTTAFTKRLNKSSRNYFHLQHWHFKVFSEIVQKLCDFAVIQRHEKWNKNAGSTNKDKT